MSPLLAILLHLIGFSVIPALCKNPSNSMRFELLHRHHPKLHERILTPENRLEHVRELVRSDNLRKHLISEMLGRRRRAWEVSDPDGSFKMPLSSGRFAGTGQYFVRFHVGTPAQKFLLVADTGSDLTWMNCRYRCRNCKRSGKSHRRIFLADKSSSFSPIECSSTACRTALPFSLTTCPTPASPCAYDYGYVDGSSAKGFFANESSTVTLSSGRRTKLHGIVIGCSSAFVGSSFREADGVLGLGHSRYSFSVKATERYGGKFSYCLVDHLSPKNVSNYLTFGPTSGCNRTMRFANLVVKPRIEPLYAVDLVGISIGGVILNIPSMVWDVNGQGGMILDSGTSLTMLVEPAYRAVFTALSEPLRVFKEVKIKPFDLCFNSTLGYKEDLVPKLGLHFGGSDGSARFEPPVKSYVIDVADGVKCIGFMSVPWPGLSTIGNILQQEHVWEFDLRNGRVGFEPSTCALD
ncbi:aspartic proteinase NANA, chloroplast [Magnolia sinica]|uniref:aspartic proteinase NANA, chloroplast n=1 Tax=Magnolia sinica TaxID=86752 RepID=UPI00265AB32D|nr:aspartic proteinase NANA, chloroplast [Magnolia sinica]